MPTKAELTDTLALSQERVTDLEIQLWDAKAKIAELENRADPLRGLTVWDAYASPGSPLCISSGAQREDPEFSLTIYTDEDVLEGVVIADLDGRTIAAAGKIPADVLLQNLGLKPI